MNKNTRIEMDSPVIIGGSAGSFKIVKRILSKLPKDFSFPIIVCIHRLKSSSGSLSETLKNSSRAQIKEVHSTTDIMPGYIYIAPADHHLLVNDQHQLYLNQEAPVKYSRPSIDITMVSFSEVYQDKVIGILLTGANTDGTLGLKSIQDNSGITIVQDPLDAEISVMPESAIKAFKPDNILSADKIINFIEKLTKE